jgi:4'-phosphopantetheinyl transferase
MAFAASKKLSNAIHLWLCDYTEIADDEMRTRLRAILSPEEKRQETRFRFERDRLRYLATRALVRTVLARYAAIAPADWVFAEDGYGRPHIANPGMEAANLSFNISHAHSLIVLGVADGRALGVDVENVERDAPLDIADQFLSPGEVAALAALSPDRQRDRFFEYWTFKESYIKARGMGLSLPLHNFSFQFPSDTSVTITVDATLTDRAEQWQLWQFRPAAEYMVAVCAERTIAGPADLVVMQTIPMTLENEIVVACSRTSPE